MIAQTAFRKGSEDRCHAHALSHLGDSSAASTNVTLSSRQPLRPPQDECSFVNLREGIVVHVEIGKQPEGAWLQPLFRQRARNVIACTVASVMPSLSARHSSGLAEVGKCHSDNMHGACTHASSKCAQALQLLRPRGTSHAKGSSMFSLAAH